DFTIFQQGPQASLVFADMGAEVIKVEAPKYGDLGRVIGSIGEDRFSPYFLAHNRGKQSITLDLKKEEATRICLQLAERCDVAIHNFRPDVMERLGLGYDDFRGVNPQIIYGHASGWGTKGPRAKHPAFDLAAQAQGGLVSVTGEPDGYPLPAGAAIADYVGAMNLALAVISALYVKERTGRGQKIETSLLGGQIAMQAWEIQYFMAHGWVGKAGRGHHYIPTIWRVFKTEDSYVVVGGLPENRWPAFCQAVGKPELEHDPRFANYFDRMAHLAEIYAILDDVFPTKSTEQWMALLAEADCICAPVATYEDLVNDPQVRANDYIVEVDHPTRGRISVVGPPWHFSETPTEVAAAAPELGQHTEAILQELSYSWEQIEALREQGVLG
ncbi:MAG: CoA transferase, partial [Acidobacteria bacterium]|nr:CoA transferase [Acidobacteriota bacterium]